MRTIFIISGFDIHKDATDIEHKSLRDGLSKSGYRVVPVAISWKQKTPSQYVEEFVKFYNKNRSDNNIVLGNSFGAVVTLLSAVKVKPNEIYLCSLSPFFKEDKHTKPESYWIKYFGKKRLDDLRSTSFNIIAKKISDEGIKTIVIHGDKEYHTSPPLVKRCEDAAQQITGAKLIVLKDTPHNMSNPNYVQELMKLF